jgi:hypothetical protein
MKQTVIVDSSQIVDFCTCPQYWAYKDHQHLVPLSEKRKPAMDKGTFGHKLLEIYYGQKALQTPFAEIDKLLKAVSLPPELPLSAEDEKFVRDRVDLYLMSASQKDDVVAGLRDEKIILIDANGLPYDSTRPVPLVEQGFSYELLNTKEYHFILEGKIDIIGNFKGMRAVTDHKFQERSHDLYERSVQFRNYTLVTDASLMIINYIRLHAEVKKDTFSRAVVSFNAIEKRVWKEELLEIFIAIARSQARNSFGKNRASCSGKYGYPCEFTKVCDEPNAAVQKGMLQNHFKIKPQEERWKPW